jgi:hypothetical protein
MHNGCFLVPPSPADTRRYARPPPHCNCKVQCKVVAAVMKYADSIVKCFASALAIIFGALISVPLFGFSASPTFVCGTSIAVVASVLYAWAPTTRRRPELLLRNRKLHGPCAEVSSISGAGQRFPGISTWLRASHGTCCLILLFLAIFLTPVKTVMACQSQKNANGAQATQFGRASVDQAIKNSPTFGRTTPTCHTIINVHFADPDNIGDMLASPLNYFPELQARAHRINIATPADEVIQRLHLGSRDTVIIGGGGLLGNPDWLATLVKYCKTSRCVVWGIGENSHQIRARVPFKMRGHRRVLENLSVAYTFRDYPGGMLDATCLHPDLECQRPPSKKQGYYLHHAQNLGKRSWTRHNQSIMYNGRTADSPAPTPKEVFDFLCDHTSIVSSSYHGILWAALLNRKVAMVDPHSDKFFYYPFSVPIWPTEGYTRIDGKRLKNECRHGNKEFYRRHIAPQLPCIQA